MIHVSVGSPAGSYNVSSSSFYRYVVRLSDVGLPLRPAERDALALLGAIPDAAYEEERLFGPGWRVVPASSLEDWPVLEATPQRVRQALETAQRVLWEHAVPAGISVRELENIEAEIEIVYAVLARAEAAGYSVSISYAS